MVTFKFLPSPCGLVRLPLASSTKNGRKAKAARNRHIHGRPATIHNPANPSKSRPTSTVCRLSPPCPFSTKKTKDHRGGGRLRSMKGLWAARPGKASGDGPSTTCKAGWMDAWDHPPAAENGRRDVVQVPRYANSSRIWKTTTTTLETTLMARDPHPYPLTPGSDQHLAVCWPAVSFRNLRCHLIRGGQAQPPHPASYIMSYPTSPGCLSSGGGAPSPTGSCRNKAPGGAVGRHTKRPGRPITANGSIVVVEILDVQKFARLWPLLLLLLTARRWREQTAWALAVWREQGRLPA